MPKKIISEGGRGGAVFSLPWLVARDEGLFAAEGLEIEFVPVQLRPSSPGFVEDHRLVDSLRGHELFEVGKADVYRACEWGQVRRSYDSTVGGQIASKRAAVAVMAILARPGSPITHPQDLRNKKVGVNFHAGSHYATLQMLEGFLQRDEIKLVQKVGGGVEWRYEALMRGEVDATALMEPWIALAEKNGCQKIIETHYVGSEIGGANLDAETFQALSQAINRAVERINADKKKYVHYLIDELPEEYREQLTPDDFYLPRLRYVPMAPYPEEQFEKTYNWMVSWGLIGPDATFEQLVDNRITVGA